jgi:hypothetical protein
MTAGRWLRGTAVALAMATPLMLAGPARAEQGISCTVSDFLTFGFQACPPGAVVVPQGYVVTPQGVLTPQGFVLTPQGQWLNPLGQPLNPPGEDFFSRGPLVSCVAQRAPHDAERNHGQIVSRVARGDLDVLQDDPVVAMVVTQCLAEISGTPLPATTFFPGSPPNFGGGDDGPGNRGRGNDDNGNSGRGRGNGRGR